MMAVRETSALEEEVGGVEEEEVLEAEVASVEDDSIRCHFLANCASLL